MVFMMWKIATNNSFFVCYLCIIFDAYFFVVFYILLVRHPGARNFLEDSVPLDDLLEQLLLAQELRLRNEISFMTYSEDFISTTSGASIST